ncbi:MAG: biopolymer transporter ExbD, partial [Marinobacter sp.]
MQLVEPRPSRPIPIRITPLIDVVFILLVFFMLTSRLMPVDHLELANST